MESQSKWIIRLVSAMWALNLLAGMVPPLKYEPQGEVNGIFMAIVGTLYLTSRAAKNEPKEDEE